MSAKKKRNRPQQGKASDDVETSFTDKLSPVKSSPSQQCSQVKLQGSARKLKDGAADWHNNIIKWKSLNSQGVNAINDIANKKLERIFAVEQLTADQTKSSEEGLVGMTCLMTGELEPLCEAMIAIHQSMTKVVTKMECISVMMRGVRELETFKHGQEAQSDGQQRLFQSWTLDQFVDTSDQLYSMYKKELDLKQTIVENVAHAKERNLLMFYTSSWLHQPFIEERAELLLESLLLETGHR